MPSPRLLAAAAALSLPVVGNLATAQGFTIRRLSGNSALVHGMANAINNARVVSGLMFTTGPVVERPVVWVDGAVQQLPEDPSSGSGWANGINDMGFVVGKSGVPTAAESGTRWDPNGAGFSTLDLGIAPGDFLSVARDVNNNTIACGTTDTGLLSFYRPCLWIGDAGVGNPFVLPPLAPFNVGGDAYAIADNDVVVGFLHDGFTSAPTIWTPAGNSWTPSLLPTLGAGGGEAADINAAGVIAGHTGNSTTGLMHMVSWTGGAITDHGAFGAVGCFAAGINLGGDIVGRTATGPSSALLRPAGGAITDLNTLLPPLSPWQLIAAEDINDRGDIVGRGSIGGFYEPFVMSPTRVAMTPPSPGVANTSNTLTATGATPNQTVFFLVSPSGGETVVRGCLESLDIAAAAVLGSASANAAGVAAFTFFAPTSLIGVPLLWQSYDLSGCASSNALAFTF